MSDFMRIMHFDPVVSLKGLRGIRPIFAEMTMDNSPYLEFVYDGGTVIQIGTFKDDNDMISCLKFINEDMLSTVTVQWSA